MTPVRLEWPIESGFKGIGPTQMVMVRNLREAELIELADADPDEILARVTGLSPDQVARFTVNDRLAIVRARQQEMSNNV